VSPQPSEESPQPDNASPQPDNAGLPLGDDSLLRRDEDPQLPDRSVESPDEIEPQPRKPLDLRARLQAGDRRWPQRCELLELSASGCLLVTRQDVAVLSIAKLRLSLPARARRPISVSGRVIRRSQDESSGDWSLALRFLDIPAHVRGRLDDLLERPSEEVSTPLHEGPMLRLGSLVAGVLGQDAPHSSAPSEAAPLEADRDAPSGASAVIEPDAKQTAAQTDVSDSAANADEVPNSDHGAAPTEASAPAADPAIEPAPDEPRRLARRQRRAGRRRR